MASSAGTRQASSPLFNLGPLQPPGTLAHSGTPGLPGPARLLTVLTHPKQLEGPSQP